MESYFDITLFMGAVLSFLLSMYLLFYPSRFFPNNILGTLVFSWSITAFGFTIQSPEFFAEFPHLYGSLDGFTLLFFPLVFLYIKYYLYSDTRRTAVQMFHFLPALAYAVSFTPFFILSGAEKIELIINGMPEWFVSLQTMFNLVIVLQGVLYSIFSLRTLHHFQYIRRRRLSIYQINSLAWLKSFLMLNILLWITGTTGVFLDIFGINLSVDLFKVFYYGITILTILLCVFAIRRPDLFTEKEEVRTIIANESAVPTESQKQILKNDYEILVRYLEAESPFLKKDLKMQDLVDATGMSYKRISEIFNNEFGKSFYDVMNEFRLKEVLRMIDEQMHLKYTLPHLADRAGFNSKTSFNRIFKKLTGKTPTEYIKSIE